MQWAIAASLAEARLAAGKVQGRRTTAEERPPLFDALPEAPVDGVRLATSWVEPAYLEPDASWCAPGGTPASPYVNGGAFGGKLESVAPAATRELAGRLDATVRVVYSREDVVRLGPKRPPIAATRGSHEGRVEIDGVVAARCRAHVRSRMADAVFVRGHRPLARGRRFGTAGLLRRCAPSDWPSRPCSSRAPWTRPASTARCSPMTRPCSTRAYSRRRARARAHASMSTARRARWNASRSASRPATPSTRSCCAPTSIGAVHMALGWVCSESLFGRSGHRRGARPHHSLVRDHPPEGHATRRRGRRARRPRCARRLVRRGVRGCRRGRVERARSRGRRAARYVPGAADARRASTQEVAMSVEPVPTPERAARGRPVFAGGARRRLARARRPGGARSRDGQDGRGRRRGPGAPSARQHRPQCSPTAGRHWPTSRRPRCSSPTSVDFATVNAVYAEAFGDHKPARSTVQVAALPGGRGGRDRSLGPPPRLAIRVAERPIRWGGLGTHSEPKRAIRWRGGRRVRRFWRCCRSNSGGFGTTGRVLARVAHNAM